MTSIYFTLVLFEHLLKDPVSINNVEFQAMITELQNLVVTQCVTAPLSLTNFVTVYAFFSKNATH